MLKKDEHWCMCWLADKPLARGAKRAALLKGKMWDPEDHISVSFLDGDDKLRDRVIQAARGWTMPGLANLTFDYRKNTTKTNIRISFQYSGSWSVLGTSCKEVEKDQATMNFGWLNPDSTDEVIRSVVLHEFGHALGLVHEHQNPGSVIKWDKPKVYADLSGPPNNWSKETIDHNMFEPYAKKETNYTKVDGKSIMMYAIPPGWTTDGFTAATRTRNSRRWTNSLSPSSILK